MFQGKHCFLLPESIDAVIQYVLKQRDVVPLVCLTMQALNTGRKFRGFITCILEYCD